LLDRCWTSRVPITLAKEARERRIVAPRETIETSADGVFV